jgi:hypothetical protein
MADYFSLSLFLYTQCLQRFLPYFFVHLIVIKYYKCVWLQDHLDMTSNSLVYNKGKTTAGKTKSRLLYPIPYPIPILLPSLSTGFTLDLIDIKQKHWKYVWPLGHLDSIRKNISREKPLQARLRADYFSLSLFLCLHCLQGVLPYFFC